MALTSLRKLFSINAVIQTVGPSFLRVGGENLTYFGYCCPTKDFVTEFHHRGSSSMLLLIIPLLTHTPT